MRSASHLVQLEERRLMSADVGSNATSIHGLLCGCAGCGGSGPGAGTFCGYDELLRRAAASDTSGSGAFNATDRWNTTFAGSTGTRGTGITLSYSFLPDGVSIPSGIGEPTSNSDLFARMNAIYGSTAVWQPIIRNAIELWGANSGITYVYEPTDDGAQFNSGTNSRGLAGVRGDVRIGGKFINGNSGVLAYNFFPDSGDMVIDTADNVFENLANSSIRLRNVISHEHGHGLGFSHSCPQNGSKLLEPFLNTNFSGVQFDEVLGVNYLYGDRLEKGTGNNTTGRATSLGGLSGSLSRSTLSITNFDPGRPGDNAVADNDFFSFNLTTRSQVTFTLSPLGSTYLAGTQNANGTCSAGVNFSPQSQLNLRLAVLAANGTTVIQSSDATGAGSAETTTVTLDPGNYFLRNFGDSQEGSKNTQLYDLQIAQSAAVSPLTVSFDAVSPDPRDSVVSSIGLRFNQPINTATLTLSDFSLFRDGFSESLSGASLITTDGTNVTIGNLAALTTKIGTYTLALSTNSVTASAGGTNATSAVASFTITGLNGTAGNDNFNLQRVSNSQARVSVNAGEFYTFNTSIPVVNVLPGAGNDTLRIEGVIGTNTTPINFIGTAGQIDTLQLVGQSVGNNSWNVFNGSVSGQTTVSFSNIALINLIGGTASDSASIFSSSIPPLRADFATGTNDELVVRDANPYPLTQAVLGNTVAMNVVAFAGARINVNSPLSVNALNVGVDGVIAIPGTARRVIARSLFILGKLDIGLSNLIVNYDAPNSPLQSIKDSLASAYNGGSWTGSSGITSSLINTADGQSVGFGEASDILSPTGGTFFGTNVDATSVVIAPRLAGDADLNGTVDFNDLVRLARNFNQSGRVFASGDFNYSSDGLVDFNDLVLLARNFNRTFLPPQTSIEPVLDGIGAGTRSSPLARFGSTPITPFGRGKSVGKEILA